MVRLDSSKDKQAQLFDQLESSRLFFITNQRNLISFLGAGMIVPAKSQFRYKEDSREFFKGALALWKGGVPDIPAVFPMISHERLVVIELDFTYLEIFLEKGKILDEKSVIVLNAPLPISAVKRIYLKSQQAIDDFLLRLTDDVIAERSLFEVLDEPCVKVATSDYLLEEFVEPENFINFVDRFGGAISSLECLEVPYSSQADYGAALSLICIEHFGLDSQKCEHSGVMKLFSDDDRAIIEALLSILSNTYPEESIDPIGVLTELEKTLLLRNLESQREIRDWLEFSSKVINSEKSVPVLDDEGDVLKRGVLLFLLRPELERLRCSRDSLIRPGSSVFLIATFFSGFFTGMQRLGSEYKGSFLRFSRFSQNLLDAFWCRKNQKFESAFKSDGANGASRTFKINDIALFSQKIEKNLSLLRVESIGKSTGYDMQYDYKEHRLIHDYILGNGRKQRVYIELVKPLLGGSEVIRFVSPCQDLSGSKRNRMLTKSRVIDLLERNSHDDMYSSFAISDSMEAIVVEATQIVRTMDDEEFELMLNHVAKMADEYKHGLLAKGSES